MKKRDFLKAGAVAAALAIPAAARAQGAKFPSRQIRIIVPFPPGGLTDAYARMVGEQLTQQLGASVVHCVGRPEPGKVVK